MGRGRGGGARGRARRRARYASSVRKSEARSMKQGWNPSRGGRTDFRSYNDTFERKQLRREVDRWQKMSESQKRANLRARGLSGSGGGFDIPSSRIDRDAMARDASEVGFETALSMCGNQGQISIIEAMGAEAWYEAIISGGELEYLKDAASHPEAVDKAILPKSWEATLDFIEGIDREDYIIS